MSAQRFGGAHTDKKLEKLEAYLKAFSTALKKQHFQLIFFDAFAGTGDIQIADEVPLLGTVSEYAPFIEGSAQRALRFGTAFDQYIFVEKSRSKIRQLENLRTQFPTISDRISIRCGDANSELEKFCSQVNWQRTRAVVFLDPFGNQVRWETIVAIAEQKRSICGISFPLDWECCDRYPSAKAYTKRMKLRLTDCWVRASGEMCLSSRHRWMTCSVRVRTMSGALPSNQSLVSWPIE